MATIITTDDHQTTERRPNGMLKVLLLLCVGLAAGIGMYLYAPLLLTRIAPQPIILIATPTVGSVPRATLPPYRQPPLEQPAIAPADAIADYNATAEAQYRAAINAAPVENVGQSAPVTLGSKPVDRLPAGENVPTAEPVQQAEGGGIFGSKPVLVNPQATHQCKHGQQWVANKGCKNQ